ncbi:unnamed protein product [Ilex paraguariensis]|uniref:PGG domain-containing protein n=1 Tax=Ilex paraguariensis TaxID=185542 RepID=A0ABC8S009_9AQUA
MSRSRDERKITIRKENRKAAKKEALVMLKKTSDTNMIVVALIVTVTFATGFTMPGGYNQSGTTNPVPRMTVLSRRSVFQAFMILDVITLLLSCVAIFFNFWGTLFDDRRIVQKFVIVTIFLVTAAIGAMMIAFSSATYVVLEKSSALAIATCLVGVVSIPISFVLCFRLGPR